MVEFYEGRERCEVVGEFYAGWLERLFLTCKISNFN